MKALGVQAGAADAVTETVESSGGFAGQHDQIERVCAHHGNFWEHTNLNVLARPAPSASPLRSAVAYARCGPGAG